MKSRSATNGRRREAGNVRLGFAGVGWIGLNRMQAILADGRAEAVAVADPNSDAAEAACAHAPGAETCRDFDHLLESDVDAIVIATPSGLHADQAIRALEAGKSVFCQKPLGRTADETRAACNTAARQNLLLGVDLSYRYTRGLQIVREAVRSGAIGDVYAAELKFHNAYGPASDWARKPDLSGGGCVIDLGIHLIDALLWTLDEVRIQAIAGGLFSEGRRLRMPADAVEDFAQVQLELTRGKVARLTCSWHFAPGRDADIEVGFHGTEGSLAFRNVDGSFYDFTAELRRGAHTEVLVEPPDEWGGRAALGWLDRLIAGQGYDPQIESLVDVAHAIDLIYGRPARFDLASTRTNAAVAG